MSHIFVSFADFNPSCFNTSIVDFMECTSVHEKCLVDLEPLHEDY